MNKERKAKKAIELWKYYTKKGDYKKWLIYFLKWVSTFYTKVSKNGDNYVSIAMLYQKVWQEEKARKYIEKSKSVYRYKNFETKWLWKLDEYDSESTSDKLEKEGYKFLERNNFKKALNKFLLAMNWADPGSRTKVKEPLYHDIAYCYENIGELEKAHEYIQKCLEISPWYLEGKVFLGNLLVHMGKQEEWNKILKECEKMEADIQKMPLDLDAFYGTKTA